MDPGHHTPSWTQVTIQGNLLRRVRHCVHGAWGHHLAVPVRYGSHHVVRGRATLRPFLNRLNTREGCLGRGMPSARPPDSKTHLWKGVTPVLRPKITAGYRLPVSAASSGPHGVSRAPGGTPTGRISASESFRPHVDSAWRDPLRLL